VAARGVIRDATMSSPHPVVGGRRSLLDTRNALQPKSPSCGNQPAHISLTARRQRHAHHGKRRRSTRRHPGQPWVAPHPALDKQGLHISRPWGRAGPEAARQRLILDDMPVDGPVRNEQTPKQPSRTSPQPRAPRTLPSHHPNKPSSTSPQTYASDPTQPPPRTSRDLRRHSHANLGSPHHLDQPGTTAHTERYSTGNPRPRAISMRWTSEVPSPISSTFASR
jgi:hypothetical protein